MVYGITIVYVFDVCIQNPLLIFICLFLIEWPVYFEFLTTIITLV